LDSEEKKQKGQDAKALSSLCLSFLSSVFIGRRGEAAAEGDRERGGPEDSVSGGRRRGSSKP